MGRIEFDSQGKLLSVDGKFVKGEKNNRRAGNFKSKWDGNSEEESFFNEGLKRGEERVFRKFENVKDSENWSLYREDKKLLPLQFSNGKTQEDVVKEIVELIRNGNKIIFLHGQCGTGKSAIALNVARVLGKTTVVVPVKALQRQYEEDYMGKMFVLKPNGEELRIAMITGRENHDSIFKQGMSCADPFLPDTIQFVEKNAALLREYYETNPLIRHKDIFNVKELRRISIAPTNPYWSPIIPANFEVQLRDAVRKRYLGLLGREFIFYHRKKGCSYYDQFQAYLDADVIIFNSAKYKIEVALDRKPETEVDIIDEADEFLDNFSNQVELNLTRLEKSLAYITSDEFSVREMLEKIRELIKIEEKRISAIGVNEEAVFKLDDTNIGKILRLLKNKYVEAEILIDEKSYANKALEAAHEFADFFEDTYLTYRKYEDSLYADLVTTNLSARLSEILNKNKAFVFMSGTLHSAEVLKNVFGIGDYKVVEAETMHQGEIDIIRTGKEFDCSYRNFVNGNFSRENYLRAFMECVGRAERPLLVHVNAFEDLPSENDIVKFGINRLISREKFIEMQLGDKTGKLVSMFKNKLSDVLYSTKCSRGVDFPGDICKSMIFTKYPNPNVQGSFWKILQRTHPRWYWDFYKDKARREFLQRLYRALRSKDDHVNVLSPDSRVLDAVRELQLRENSGKNGR